MTSRISCFLVSNRTTKLASFVRLTHVSSTTGSSPTPKASGSAVPDVQGVTKNVVEIPSADGHFGIIEAAPMMEPRVPKWPSAPLGPGASKAGNYKNPEYFAYHQWSFYEANVEMDKFRLPQPSAIKEN